MLQIRRDPDIHREDGGWFRARWHFSFDHYWDPEQMGLGPLRVFNDDRIVAGAEWPLHPHQDLESLTYVVEGEFGHADSLGNGGRLQAGGAQVMSFSHEGALHSERNASDHEDLRFLQFWILPGDEDLETSVQQYQFQTEDRTDRWIQIMGPSGEEGLELSQDARVYVSRPEPATTLTHHFPEGRGGYVYLMDGEATFDEEKVASGDAAKIFGPHDLTVTAVEATELILVEVPLEFRPMGVWAAGG